MRFSINDGTVASIVLFMIFIVGIHTYLRVKFVFASVLYIILSKDRDRLLLAVVAVGHSL